MIVYAIKNKETGKIYNDKFYIIKRFAKCAMTYHGMQKEKFEIVQYELINEKVVDNE